MTRCLECHNEVMEPSLTCNGCGFEVQQKNERERDAFLQKRPFVALVAPWLYAFGTRQYGWFCLSLLGPFYLVAAIYLYRFGRIQAWRNGSWTSFEEFYAREHVIKNVFGIVIVIFIVVISWYELINRNG